MRKNTNANDETEELSGDYYQRINRTRRLLRHLMPLYVGENTSYRSTVEQENNISGSRPLNDAYFIALQLLKMKPEERGFWIL